MAFSELQKSQFRHRLFPHHLHCDHYLQVFEEVEISSHVEFVVCDGFLGFAFGLAGGEEGDKGVVPKHKQSPLALAMVSGGKSDQSLAKGQCYCDLSIGIDDGKE